MERRTCNLRAITCYSTRHDKDGRKNVGFETFLAIMALKSVRFA